MKKFILILACILTVSLASCQNDEFCYEFNYDSVESCHVFTENLIGDSCIVFANSPCTVILDRTAGIVQMTVENQRSIIYSIVGSYILGTDIQGKWIMYFTAINEEGKEYQCTLCRNSFTLNLDDCGLSFKYF